MASDYNSGLFSLWKSSNSTETQCSDSPNELLVNTNKFFVPVGMKVLAGISKLASSPTGISLMKPFFAPDCPFLSLQASLPQ